MTAATSESLPAGSPEEAATEPLLEIVIVAAGGGRELVCDCVRSLERHPLRSPTNVWLVDNASADGTPETVRAEFPWLRLVPSSIELGLLHRHNIALRSSTAPCALLLNPGTDVLEGSLDHMVDVMRERPDVGVAECRLVLRDGSFDHAAKRRSPLRSARSPTSPASAAVATPRARWPSTAPPTSASTTPARSTP